MLKKIINVALLLFVFQLIHAQKSTVRPGWKFHSINEAGLLSGESGSAFHVQSVNGVRFKSLFAGIGAGLDYYQYRSFPVFAEIRNYFGKKKAGFFAYADGGVHFVWDKKEDYGNQKAKYYPRFYSNVGIGYQTAFKNGSGLSLSAGYSYKNVKFQRDSYNFCPLDGPCGVYGQTYNYDFNRIILQIGLIF